MTITPPPTETHRIHSIDLVRGLTILVMLFVNDLAGVSGAPAWMKHSFPYEADGMTFVDVVFPAFLFIVGLSLPIALERRLKSSAGLRGTIGHILQRTVSLLIIGVFMVNSENISAHGPLHPRLWSLLLYLAVCLIWILPSQQPGLVGRVRRMIGLLLLIILGLLYRGEPGLIGLRPHWWGILGLIGWAYLVTAILYLLLRRNALGFSAAVALLYIVFAADSAGFFAPLGQMTRWIGIGSMLGSHAAITASGALLGIMLFSADQSHGRRIRRTLLFAAILAAAGVMLHSAHALHPMFIYNKNAATPPWCLVSSAWTALIFATLYWLQDARGIERGTAWLSTAGQNALFAFILGPIFYYLLGFLSSLAVGFNFYAQLGAGFSTGFFRSLIFALSATFLTGWLQRKGWGLRI